MKKLTNIEQEKTYENEMRFIIELIKHRKEDRHIIKDESDKRINEHILNGYFFNGNGMITISEAYGIINQATAARDREILQNLIK